MFSSRFGRSVVLEGHGVAEPLEGMDFGAYLRGLQRAMGTAGLEPVPIECVIESDLVPGGVSSSAALLVALHGAQAHLRAGGRMTTAEVAMLLAEAEFLGTGTRVGVLDPLVILSGKPRTLVQINGVDASVKHFRLPRDAPDHSWYVIYSGEPRRLSESPYNQRVQECLDAASELLGDHEPHRLREVSQEHFRRRRASLSPRSRLRAEHYFSEIQRVRRGSALFSAGDLSSFGLLMNASAESLIRNFDVGTRATEWLVRHLQTLPYVMGSTFCGGGFGGNVQVLAARGREVHMRENLKEAYAGVFPELAPNLEVVEVGMGEGPSRA